MHGPIFRGVAALFVVAFLVSSVAAAEGDVQAWLETGLPAVIDAGKEPPFEITGIKFERNHCDQELLTAQCRRSRVITTLAEEVKLVILPSGGGRYAVHAPRQMTISPQAAERFGAITDFLLNYRGEIPGGARAYLEMRAASPVDRKPAVRISKVAWIGTQEQLAAAMKKGPPPTVEAGQSAKVTTVALSDNVALPVGVPVQYQLGGHTRAAKVYEAAQPGSPVLLQVFLARPGGLFKPWIVEALRQDIRVEPEVLQAAAAEPEQFATRLRNQQQLLTSMRLGAPQRLTPAAGETIAVGQRLLMFSLGNLSSMEATAPPENGVITLRNPKGGKETRAELAHLYLDPEAPKPAAAPTVAKTATVASATSSPAAPTAGAPNSAPTSSPGYRLWKDSTGRFEIEALLLSLDNGLVRLLRRDRKEISVPFSRLSDADQKFIEKSLSESSNPFDP